MELSYLKGVISLLSLVLGVRTVSPFEGSHLSGQIRSDKGQMVLTYCKHHIFSFIIGPGGLECENNFSEIKGLESFQKIAFDL